MHTIRTETMTLLKAERCTLFIVDRENGSLWFHTDAKDGGEKIEMPISQARSLCLASRACSLPACEAPSRCHDACDHHTSHASRTRTRTALTMPRGSQGMAGEVALTGETINVADVYNDARFDRTMDIKTGYRTKSMLCMPILNKSRHTVGVAQLLNKEGGGAFTMQDEQVFASISAHLAVSLTNADLYSEMVKTASPQTHAPCASTHTTVGSGATRARLVASMHLSTCTVVASSPTIPPSPSSHHVISLSLSLSLSSAAHEALLRVDPVVVG